MRENSLPSALIAHQMKILERSVFNARWDVALNAVILLLNYASSQMADNHNIPIYMFLGNHLFYGLSRCQQWQKGEKELFRFFSAVLDRRMARLFVGLMNKQHVVCAPAFRCSRVL